MKKKAMKDTRGGLKDTMAGPQAQKARGNTALRTLTEKIAEQQDKRSKYFDKIIIYFGGLTLEKMPAVTGSIGDDNVPK